MDITLGCSIEMLRTQAAYRTYPVINIENPLYPGYLDQDHVPDMQYLQDEISQRIILDGPYIDLNLGSPEPKARHLAREKVLEAITFARHCHAEEIIFLSTFLPWIGLASYERGWIEESIRSWRIISDYESVIRLSLCNTFEYTPANLLEIVETINRPNLGLAWDIGHCIVWGQIPVIEWYRQIRERCRTVYLHSNHGTSDDHLSIQTGKIVELDILQRLSTELNEENILILKYFDAASLASDITYARSIFAR